MSESKRGKNKKKKVDKETLSTRKAIKKMLDKVNAEGGSLFKVGPRELIAFREIELAEQRSLYPELFPDYYQGIRI
jgi:hypothetical protein